MAKEGRYYRCDCCGSLNSHADSYNDKYCYDCIDLDTGKLKEGLTDKEEKVSKNG